MKRKINCFICVVLVTLMTIGASVAVFGDSISKSVEIFFKDIKIFSAIL